MVKWQFRCDPPPLLRGLRTCPYFPNHPPETCQTPAEYMPVAETTELKLRKSGALKYELLLLIVSVIWGSAFAAQQIGMQKGLGPMTFNGWRFALGSLALVPVIFWRKKITGRA